VVDTKGGKLQPLVAREALVASRRGNKKSKGDTRCGSSKEEREKRKARRISKKHFVRGRDWKGRKDARQSIRCAQERGSEGVEGR
jgi:hypothetical protein